MCEEHPNMESYSDSLVLSRNEDWHWKSSFLLLLFEWSRLLLSLHKRQYVKSNKNCNDDIPHLFHKEVNASLFQTKKEIFWRMYEKNSVNLGFYS